MYFFLFLSLSHDDNCRETTFFPSHFLSFLTFFIFIFLIIFLID